MEKREEIYINQLKNFLRFPSISSDARAKQAVNDCAVWLLKHLKTIGLPVVELYPTKLHPILYAERILHPSYKTILFYGHYDVQPVAPLADWLRPPFAPFIENNYLYARGASDDKGQLFIQVKAIEECIKEQKQLPINIKCLYEGEEEMGSPNLEAFINQHAARLVCDVIVVSDTKMLSVNQPAITYALRGCLNAELVITRPGKEAHSGTFSGMLQNPVNVMANFISRLQNKDGKINIPGFYTDVKTMATAERLFMQQQGPTNEALLKDAVIKTTSADTNYTLYENTTIRPALSISGISSGHIGEGVKNIIPVTACVKMNMRLVANQHPQQVANDFAAFVKANIPASYSYQLNFSSMAKPVEIERAHPYMQAALDAYHKIFLVRPALLRSGGTIPVVSWFKEILHAPTMLMGFALASDDMHAPNEKFYLPNFFRGIKTIKQFMKNVAATSMKAPGNNGVLVN